MTSVLPVPGWIDAIRIRLYVLFLNRLYVDEVLHRLGLVAAPQPQTLAQLGVEEDRQAELVADAARDLARARASMLRILRSDRHDGNDVRGADARVHAFVRPQVDKVSRARNAGEQRIGDRVLVADEGEDGPVVVGVDVHVEHARVRGERGADRVDDRAVAAFGEVRDAL